MDQREYLRKLGIDLVGIYNKDNYVIDIDNSKDFGKVFTILEDNEDLEQAEENQLITDQGLSLIFYSKSEPYMITLIGDLDGDVYTLTISEI